MKSTNKKETIKTPLKKVKKVTKSSKENDKKAKKSAQEFYWEIFRENLEEKLLGDKFPSKIKSKVWLFATKENSNYPASTIRSGKWCVFVNKPEHDMWWDRIKQSLLEGKLGKQIKTNTAIVNPRASSQSKAVIIIFTYDYEDKNDVMRIRDELRQLGITWKVAYKADSATRSNKYISQGDTKISIYYE